MNGRSANNPPEHCWGAESSICCPKTCQLKRFEHVHQIHMVSKKSMVESCR